MLPLRRRNRSAAFLGPEAQEALAFRNGPEGDYRLDRADGVSPRRVPCLNRRGFALAEGDKLLYRFMQRNPFDHDD